MSLFEPMGKYSFLVSTIAWQLTSTSLSIRDAVSRSSFVLDQFGRLPLREAPIEFQDSSQLGKFREHHQPRIGPYTGRTDPSADRNPENL